MNGLDFSKSANFLKISYSLSRAMRQLPFPNIWAVHLSAIEMVFKINIKAFIEEQQQTTNTNEILRMLTYTSVICLGNFF